MLRTPASLATFLLVSLVACSLSRADDDAAKDKEAEKAKKATLASLTLKTDFSEGPESEGLFGSMQPRLHEVIKRLDKAAGDSKLRGVVLNIKSPQMEPGM